MNKKAVRWLFGELPELVGNGVLSSESAEKLRRYYSDFDRKSTRPAALTVCSILGALLIGLGIILLLAHNWNELSRPVRTVVSLTPLILGQVLAGWTIVRRKESVAWREGSATFLTIAIGASISLISQTYHIPGDMASFTLTWSLLAVPLVYLMHASVPAILYLVGITTWAGFTQGQGGHAIAFWPLGALIVPHFWQAIKENRYGVRSSVLGWAISLCLSVSIGIILEKVLPGLWIVAYSGLLAVLYLTGALWFGEAPTIWRRPFHTVGAAGIPVLSLLLTYEWPWETIGWRFYRSGRRLHEFAAISDYFLTAALLIIAAYIVSTCLRRGQTDKLLFGAAPIVAGITYLLCGFGLNDLFPIIMFNAYLLVLGVGTIALGVRDGRLSVVNIGMLIMTAAIVARFFDSSMGFVVRGVAFIILGIGFLTTNLLLLRRGVEK